MMVEWARLARVGERSREWSQQERPAVPHSDPQICHRNPPLSPAPRPSNIATQYRDRLSSKCGVFAFYGQPLTLHRALRRMAGLVLLLVFWALAGACQRHGVGGVLLCNSSSSFYGQLQRPHRKRTTRPVAAPRNASGRTHRTIPITNCHDSPWFESFRYHFHFALFWSSFWLAISEPGLTSRGGKSQLESGLNQRDRALSAASPINSFVKTAIFFPFPGLCPPG